MVLDDFVYNNITRPVPDCKDLSLVTVRSEHRLSNVQLPRNKCISRQQASNPAKVSILNWKNISCEKLLLRK